MFRAIGIVLGVLALAGAAVAESDRSAFSRIQASLTEQLNVAIAADIEREVTQASLQIPLPESREDKLAASGLTKTR